MKKILRLVGLVLALGAQAHSATNATGGNAVGASGGKKSVARMLDNSGNPIAFNDDKPWKVFSFEFQTAPAQLVDEAGIAPKQGLVKRICMESAPAIPAALDNAVVWDTAVAATMSLTGPGRRIAPPIQRLSGVEKCVEINAEFTSGLGVMQGVSGGSTYVYWRELGGFK
jgi:hypothetical protein